MVCGQNLVLLANAFALAIAEGQTGDELEVLGAFFTLIGDQLAIFSACSPDSGNKADNENTDNSDAYGQYGQYYD